MATASASLVTMDPQKDDQTAITLPMTSISNAPSGDENSAPWIFYLTVMGEQAEIALRHLLAIWKIEGDPPDLGVWSHGGQVDEQQVWTHLQGALFAGISLARMLDPHLPNVSSKASSGQRVRQENRRKYAEMRARKLRGLLDIEDDSALLQIRRVRDALEHFDERIDDLVLAGDVASVSDFHITLGGQLIDIPSSLLTENETNFRHVTMRQFAPELGVLYFGDDFIDLFAYEVALHNLLAAMPDAYDNAEPRPSNLWRYGSTRIALWPEDQVAQRRSDIAAVREEVYKAGYWLLRPVQRPRTVMGRWKVFPEP